MNRSDLWEKFLIFALSIMMIVLAVLILYFFLFKPPKPNFQVTDNPTKVIISDPSGSSKVTVTLPVTHTEGQLTGSTVVSVTLTEGTIISKENIHVEHTIENRNGDSPVIPNSVGESLFGKLP